MNRRSITACSFRHAAILVTGLAATLLGGCATDKDVIAHAALTNGSIAKQTAVQVRDVDAQAYVNSLARKVLDAARSDRARFETEQFGKTPTAEESAANDWIYDRFDALIVLDKEANAFVVGDDKVYVHSGLLADLETPEQLLACLTHEFSHIRLRHCKDRMDGQRRAVGLGVANVLASFVPGVGGAAAQIGTAVAGQANGLATHCHNKDQEGDADLLGLRTYTAMGYDAEQFARFFDVLKAKYGDGGLMSTHPKNSDRAAAVRKWAAEHPTATTAHLDPAEYQRVRASVLREQAAFHGQTLTQQPGLRASLVTCFDYCHVKQDQK